MTITAHPTGITAWERRGYRLRLAGYRGAQTVSGEVDLQGSLTDVAFRRQLHDTLDQLIFSAIAAERNGS